MKIENIPGDIKSKSLKEARDEIDAILLKLENQETNLDKSKSDYQRLILLNKHIDELFKKKFREILGKKNDDKKKVDKKC
tara:strand:- start:623 stop:862 length:240 start_codon:yes stop_codon:yes gene_type:complete